MTGPTVAAGELVRRGLAALGVEAVYGAPLPGVPVVPAEPARVAALLAEAHLLVHRSRCALHHDGVLTVLERAARPPDTGPPRLDVADGDALAEVWATADALLRSPGGSARAPARDTSAADAPAPDTPAPGTAARDTPARDIPARDTPAARSPVAGASARAVEIGLGLEPAAPVTDRIPVPPDPVDRWVEPAGDDVERLAAARMPVALVGPGVADPAHVPGLHALAAAGSLGVLNTWGAKGVFHWRSRHHWATVGLQARDLDLGGLDDADLVVASGLDQREVPGQAGWTVPVLTVPPGALGPLAERWGRPRTELAVPPLRAGLAAVTQAGWSRDDAPLLPSRVTLAYATAVGDRGLVAADPGTAGYWVARTFATTSLGGAVVPARAGAAGLAAACVAVARLRSPGRPALAAVDGPDLDTASAEVVEAADRLGVAVPVECWDPDGPRLDAETHVARLRVALAAGRGSALALATDPSQLDQMVDVAGPVVAWR